MGISFFTAYNSGKPSFAVTLTFGMFELPTRLRCLQKTIVRGQCSSEFSTEVHVEEVEDCPQLLSLEDIVISSLFCMLKSLYVVSGL